MIDLDPADLAAAAAAFPGGTTLVMINLLRFRDQAHYPPDRDVEPCTGRAAYFDRYIPAFAATVEPFGATRVLYAGDVAARMVGPVSESWDAVALVEYPSFAVFHSLVTDPAYLAQAEPHRSAALADWRLLATTTLG